VHFAFSPERCGVWIRIVGRLRARGTTTSWDFGWDPLLPRRAGFAALMGAVDFVFVNELESALYARATRYARAAIVKLGRRGSLAIADGVRRRVPAPRVRVVDTTGAGDAFNGGFLYARLRGRPLRECLAMGNFVGAQSTRAPGGLDALPRGRVDPARPARPARPASPKP
jgi:sugar/nucleoside kinase (ribokinase family)